ncbi:FtsX-like permease family protein [Hungatella effluvii]|nr:FtsX-like permease family protein [Hungatella effluvii]
MNNLFYTRLAIQNLKKNSAVTVPYLLTCIGSVMMYYIISSLTGNPGFARMRGGGSMAFILMLGCVVMAVFSVMFLIYTNSFLVKRRKQEFGLFQVLGMGKKHLARIMAIETLLTAAVSLVSGILLGFLLYRVFALLLYRLMKLDISWDFSFVPEAAFA